MQWYLKVIQNYTNFSGRARRREYWMFALFNIIISFVLGLISGLIQGTQEVESFGIVDGIALLYGLFILLPSLAVSIRRLHDTGRSGWWVLIALVPVASLLLLYYFVQDSQAGENEYGANPKEAVAAYNTTY